MSFTFAVFITAFAIILWAGRILPRALNDISQTLHLSQFVTAFLLVSLATSLPELFIGVSSAIQGIPSLSLGNVMGANLINITFIIGVSVLLAGTIEGDGKISSQNFWLVFLASMLPVFLATDGVISRGDGVLLLIAFGLYIAKLFNDRQYFHRDINHEGEPTGFHDIANVLRQFGRFLFATGALVVGALTLIASGKLIIAEYFGSDFLLFGVVVVAFGTALPELIFGIRASLAGEGQAMLGNALGTVPFNATAVVGLVSILSPIKIDLSSELLLVAAFLFAAFLLFHLFVYTRKRITRLEALALLLLYAGFILAGFLL